MMFHFPLFSIVFFIGAALALVLIFKIWTRRIASGSSIFVCFLLTLFIWILTNGLEAGAVDFNTKVFWGRSMYWGAVFTGVMWLIFALEYTGSKWCRRPRNIVLLLIIPIFSLIGVWTNQWHHLYWTNIYPSPGTSGEFLVWEHGPLFWIMAIYNYVMVFSGILILVRFNRRKAGYGRQLLIILMATLIALSGNAIYLLGLSPIPGLDLSPFSFVLAGVIYAFTILQYHFLDVVPVARGLLIEKMPDGILVLNPEGIIVDANPAVKSILGISQNGAILGKRLDAVWPKLDILLSKLDGEQHTEMSIDSLKRIDLDINIIPLQGARGDKAGKLVVLRDITQYRHMEQTLRESEYKYETVVEQSNEGVLILQDGVYRFANRTMADISGYSVEELAGKAIPFAIAEEDHQLVLERYRQRVSGSKVPDIYEINVLRKDGGRRNLEISVGTISFEGKLANIVTFRDITERNLTQRKLEALYREEQRLSNSLQEEMAKRNKYTRALVHELNTPLTAILASSELLETEMKEGVFLALAKNIRRASLNLKQRIDELMELSRGEAGTLKISHLPTDLGQLVREVALEAMPEAENKNIKLELEIAEVKRVNGDSVRLRQVMANLLSNAIKYTDQGKVLVKVSQPNDIEVLVEVWDTGRGIEKEKMENLFDPYRRKVNEGQSLSGLGIGLALTKFIIDLHGGQIWVESVPGKGSTFKFTVPVFNIEMLKEQANKRLPEK